MKKSNLTPNYIKNILEKHKGELRKYSVKKIGLFGSFLKKSYNKSSDLDFLVVFNKTSFDNYMELKFLLEKIFKRKVDLVIENTLKPALKYLKKEALYVKKL